MNKLICLIYLFFLVCRCSGQIKVRLLALTFYVDCAAAGQHHDVG